MHGLIFDTELLYRDAIIAAAGDGGHDMPLATIELSGEATRALFCERFGKGFDFGGFWITARAWCGFLDRGPKPGFNL
jgi:hypothetical protein